MSGNDLPVEFGLSIKMNGISTGLSVEVCPEAFQLLPGLESERLLTGSTLADQLGAEIEPMVSALIPRLVEANQLVFADLLRACVEPRAGGGGE